jgi:hypothetical protein
MKANKLIFIIGAVLLLGIAGFFVVSCGKEEVKPDENLISKGFPTESGNLDKTEPCVPPKAVRLVDGNETNALYVGDLSISNDGQNINIATQLLQRWFTAKTYVFVGDRKDIPLDPQGEPIVEQFPTVVNHKPRTKQHNLSVPMPAADKFVIVYYTEVFEYDLRDLPQNHVKAWGEGKRVGAKKAMAIEYCR